MQKVIIQRRIEEDNGFVGDTDIIEKDVKAISKAIDKL